MNEMSTLKWTFEMSTTIEPTWSVQQLSGERWKLVAYAKRARDGGWFVRIGNVNPKPSDEKMYIGDDVFPPEYMLAMLHMTHRNPLEDGDE